MSQNDPRKSLIALQPEQLQSQGQTCQWRWSSAAAQIDSQNFLVKLLKLNSPRSRDVQQDWSEEFMTLEYPCTVTLVIASGCEPTYGASDSDWFCMILMASTFLTACQGTSFVWGKISVQHPVSWNMRYLRMDPNDFLHCALKGLLNTTASCKSYVPPLFFKATSCAMKSESPFHVPDVWCWPGVKVFAMILTSLPMTSGVLGIRITCLSVQKAW